MNIEFTENEKVELTKSEVESLCDYFETFFIQNIKDDPDVDSLLWLDNMMSIWHKCGWRKRFTDGDE